MELDWLRGAADPLLKLAAALGTSRDELRAREELQRVSLRKEDLPAGLAESLPAEVGWRAINFYGDSLVCRFMLGGSDVLLELKPGADEAAFRADFAAGVESVKSSGSPTVELELELDKRSLLERRLGEVPECAPFLYLFPEQLEEFFRYELPKLERPLWGEDGAKKVVLIVPGRDIYLNGNHLAIVGGEYLKGFWTVAKTAQTQRERAARLYAQRPNISHWQETWFKYLTPLHLSLQEEDEQVFDANDSIVNSLNVHLVNLFLLYTADRASARPDGSYAVMYLGSGQSVDVGLSRTDFKLGKGSRPAVGALVQVMNWVYQDEKAAERAKLLQVIFAQALGTAEEADRYRLLLSRAESLRKDLDLHWKAFMADKVKAYVDQVQALEGHIGETVKAVADQIDEMIKGLSTTMLAAVAAFIASVIAAIFKDKFDPVIFAGGIIAYGLYLLSFPLLLGLTNQWGRYRALLKNFKARRARFVELLFQEKVDEVVGEQVAESEKRFTRWFTMTFAAYMILLGVIAATVVYVVEGINTYNATLPPVPTPLLPAA